MVPFSPVRLSLLHQILSSLSSFRSCAPLQAGAARNWWSTAVTERGWGGGGVQVVAAVVVAVSGLCALPQKKSKSTQEERVRGGWGWMGTAREGWVEVEVAREEDTRERSDPVPEAPPESRERKKLPPHQHPRYTQCRETSQ